MGIGENSPSEDQIVSNKIYEIESEKEEKIVNLIAKLIVDFILKDYYEEAGD